MLSEEPRSSDSLELKTGRIHQYRTGEVCAMKKVICLVIGMMLVLSCSLSHAEMKAWSTMKNFKVKTMEGQTFNLYQELETKELVLIDYIMQNMKNLSLKI